MQFVIQLNKQYNDFLYKIKYKHKIEFSMNKGKEKFYGKICWN